MVLIFFVKAWQCKPVTEQKKCDAVVFKIWQKESEVGARKKNEENRQSEVKKMLV